MTLTPEQMVLILRIMNTTRYPASTTEAEFVAIERLHARLEGWTGTIDSKIGEPR